MKSGLSKIEVKARWALDELHRGKAQRERALAFLTEAGNGPLAVELRDAVGKRGRQPFGRTHLWHEIGAVNDVMRDAGETYASRIDLLCGIYLLDKTQIATAIGKYERAMEGNRKIDRS